MKLQYTYAVIALGCVIASLQGCGIYAERRFDNAISAYHANAGSLQLGDSKEKVLSLLLPLQEDIPLEARRVPESFMLANKTGTNELVEIYYFRFRSRRPPNGINTDDEYTPYVFTNGVLTSIGWTALGGPKTIRKLPDAPKVLHVPQPESSGRQNTRTNCRPDYAGGFNCTTQ